MLLSAAWFVCHQNPHLTQRHSFSQHWMDSSKFHYHKSHSWFSLSLWGRDLKKQLLTKVEKSRYNIPKTLTLYLNCFSALGCPENKQLQKFAHMKDFWCLRKLHQGWSQSQAMGNIGARRASQSSKEAQAVCVDTAPFPLGIYYLLKTNLLVSGSSGFLRASCNISPGLQSHN